MSRDVKGEERISDPVTKTDQLKLADRRWSARTSRQRMEEGA